MKPWSVIAAILVLAAAASSHFLSAAPQPAPVARPTWEYKYFLGEPGDSQLKDAGADGWELVAVVAQHNNSNIQKQYFYLKRQK